MEIILKMDPNPDEILGTFLQGLVSGLQTHTLNRAQKQRVGEFYMSYLFSEEVDADKRSRRHSRKRRALNDDDFMRFLTLGYYVYNHILDDEPLDD